MLSLTIHSYLTMMCNGYCSSNAISLSMGFLLIFLFLMAAVLLRLFPSLWASGNGLCLWVQANLQLLNALVCNYSWHCMVWSVSFQKSGVLKPGGSRVQFHLPFSSVPLDAWHRWWARQTAAMPMSSAC